MHILPGSPDLAGLTALTGESDFCLPVLAYTDTVDALARRLMLVGAVALDLPPDYLDTAFAESPFSFWISHDPPDIQPVGTPSVGPSLRPCC